jgi:RNA polymerase sigma-70 factor (ECF subfamily)
MAQVTLAFIERVFRQEYAHAVAVLVRVFGNIDDAEEAVQEAFIEAVRRWPSAGPPPSPAGWIITTARRRGIDRYRSNVAREERHARSAPLDVAEEAEEEHVVRDDQLRLIFTCCHPALALNAQVALTLRLLGGLTTTEIARAFLVPEVTMARRLVRAKGKIRDAGIPYRVPDAEELPARLHAALAVIYLIFNEGYKASAGSTLVRDDLCAQAIRLGRLLVELMPEQSEALGLLAMMLLIHARRGARVAMDGRPVRLVEQDRALWDREMIAEGIALIGECVRRNQPGPYQIQAAINAVHCSAESIETTDWPQIVQLYDQLLALAPSAVVALNRAIAVAEVLGPEAGLELIAQCELPDYYLYHAIRAELLHRAGRSQEALDAYESAIARVDNAAERDFLQRQRQMVADTPRGQASIVR